ncbi:MAG: DsbA family protein, partial [Firmicutes bacterium]|nr:DsbA family protein [Bacillota bacterium]
EPYAGEHAEGTSLTRLMNKYKLSEEDARERLSSITQMGRDEGLEFNYETARATNTMDAHRLTKLAQSKSKGCVAGCQIDSVLAGTAGGKSPKGGLGDPGLADRVIEALFHAYIAEGKELADKSVLLEVAEKCGMDIAEVSAMLDSTDLRGEVVLEERAATANGVHVVPFFVIGDYVIPGVIEVEQYKSALRDALKLSE